MHRIHNFVFIAPTNWFISAWCETSLSDDNRITERPARIKPNDWPHQCSIFTIHRIDTTTIPYHIYSTRNAISHYFLSRNLERPTPTRSLEFTPGRALQPPQSQQQNSNCLPIKSECLWILFCLLIANDAVWSRCFLSHPHAHILCRLSLSSCDPAFPLTLFGQ